MQMTSRALSGVKAARAVLTPGTQSLAATTSFRQLYLATRCQRPVSSNIQKGLDTVRSSKKRRSRMVLYILFHQLRPSVHPERLSKLTLITELESRTGRVRRFDPVDGKPDWRESGNFHYYAVHISTVKCVR